MHTASIMLSPEGTQLGCLVAHVARSQPCKTLLWLAAPTGSEAVHPLVQAYMDLQVHACTSWHPIQPSAETAIICLPAMLVALTQTWHVLKASMLAASSPEEQAWMQLE